MAVLESAPRASRGFDETQQAILAARASPAAPGGASFETPTPLRRPGLNGSPSVAIDPASDRAVVAWQTSAGGSPPSPTPCAAARRACSIPRRNARTASRPKANPPMCA